MNAFDRSGHVRRSIWSCPCSAQPWRSSLSSSVFEMVVVGVH
jgi:hypothetical protein